VYEAKRSLVRVDELLIIHAKVSKDEYSGGQRIVAEQVLDLTTARIEFGKRVKVELPDGASATTFEKLRSGLLPFVCKSVEQPGLDVYVFYNNQDALCELKLPMAWRVRPQDEFVATLNGAMRLSVEKVTVAIEY
jgi:DNA polymerase III subunit alpha